MEPYNSYKLKGLVIILFYDIEAFPQYWCVVVVDDELETRHVFEDVESLRGYYKRHRKNTWVGYNSRQYDAPMLRFIMLGLDPFECSQALIVHNKKWFEFGYNVTQLYKRIPLRNFDCALLNKGLKKLEGFRGSSIIETSVPFDTDRILTREEKDEIVHYCTHDVLETRKVFIDTKEEYDAHESLVSAFELEDEHFSKTKAQLVALILGAQRPKQPWFDEWEFEIPDTLVLDKYTHVLEWFRDPNNHNYKVDLKTDIAGVPHTFAWGGIHGAIPKYIGEGTYINMDVASYYPALIIEYGYLSRNVIDNTKYRRIRDDRLVLKKNKNPKQLPYKIVLNSTYGAKKDRYNPLYDPRQGNSICIGGQLLLLDLIEKLEEHCDLIQSNTDGVLVKLRDDADYDKIIAIGQKWSERTLMELEYDKFVKVIQKDVNNYIIVPEGDLFYNSGMPTWKSKGAWAKPWFKEVEIDGVKTVVNDYTEYDLVIVRKAIHNHFVHGIPVEQTINECDELREFQKIIKISHKYDYAMHGGKKVDERHLRVFASLNKEDGDITKLHAIKKTIARVDKSMPHAFIENGNVETTLVHDYPLNKQWYINLAKERIRKFGDKGGS